MINYVFLSFVVSAFTIFSEEQTTHKYDKELVQKAPLLKVNEISVRKRKFETDALIYISIGITYFLARVPWHGPGTLCPKQFITFYARKI